MSRHGDLQSIALREFAIAGYTATSLQRIAEIAGLSKSSVLYHFVSKEALLETAITPAVDRMERMIAALEATGLGEEGRGAFIGDFVEFLLEHREEVHLFINQGRSLADLPVMEHANRIIARLTVFFLSTARSTEERMRFGVALGGAACTLASQGPFTSAKTPPGDPALDEPPTGEIRAALVSIVTELLSPIPARPALV